MKQVIKNEVISSLIMIVLGIILMVWPGAAMDVACLVIGGGLIIAGVVGLLVFFAKRKKSGAEGVSKDGLIAIMKFVVMIVFGIILLAKKQSVVSVLPFVIGVLIIVNSAVNMIQAILNRKQNDKWIISLLVGCATAIIGLLMVLDPFGAAISQIFIMGLGLAVDGISNLVNGLTARK